MAVTDRAEDIVCKAWPGEEVKRLFELVDSCKGHKLMGWEYIAYKLGTGRTAEACIGKHRRLSGRKPRNRGRGGE